MGCNMMLTLQCVTALLSVALLRRLLKVYGTFLANFVDNSFSSVIIHI